MRKITQLIGFIVLTAFLATTVVRVGEQPAHACSVSPRFDFSMSYLTDLDTIDDLYLPDGPYATDWKRYHESRGLPIPTLPRITAIAYVSVVGTITANTPRTSAVNGRVSTLTHEWGDSHILPGPQRLGLSFPGVSCEAFGLRWQISSRSGIDGEALSGDSSFEEIAAHVTTLFDDPLKHPRDFDAEQVLLEELATSIDKRSNPPSFSYTAERMNADGVFEPWQSMISTPTAAPSPAPQFTG